MNIRPMTFDDLADCAGLYSSVFSAKPWSEPWTESAALKRLSHLFESADAVGLVAEAKKLEGFLLGATEPFYYGDMYYLREMCVAPDSQGQGVGSALLQALNRELAARQVKGLYLITEREIPAADFYIKNGIAPSSDIGVFSCMFDE